MAILQLISGRVRESRVLCGDQDRSFSSGGDRHIMLRKIQKIHKGQESYPILLIWLSKLYMIFGTSAKDKNQIKLILAIFVYLGAKLQTQTRFSTQLSTEP